jgi:AraC-like DNA-binding protein
MATEVGLSERGLRAACKAQGLPAPVRWRAWSRLFARTLCVQGDPSASQTRLALLLGDADASAFGRLFRNELGLTPSWVRQRLGWQWVALRWLERHCA